MEGNKLLLILIAINLIACSAQSYNCASDSDCGRGYRCQEIQECDDYGCQEPIFECIETDEFSSSAAIFTSGWNDDYEEPVSASRVQQAQPEPIRPVNQAQQGASQAARLTIRTQNNFPSVLRFDSNNNPSSVFELGLNPLNGEWSISNYNRPIIRINEQGDVVDMTDDVTLRTHALEIHNLWSFTDTQFRYNGVPQWKLVYDEVFMVGQPAEGWSLPEATSQCGAMSLLGGYCRTSTQTLAKSYTGLPQHTRVRIQANFHFIDSWSGDTAYMKVTQDEDMHSMTYAWTDSFDYVSTRNAINVCGRDIGEGKFNQFIDFEMLHSYDTIKVMFGTSLEQDSCSASYGISSLRVLVI